LDSLERWHSPRHLPPRSIAVKGARTGAVAVTRRRDQSSERSRAAASVSKRSRHDPHSRRSLKRSRSREQNSARANLDTPSRAPCPVRISRHIAAITAEITPRRDTSDRAPDTRRRATTLADTTDHAM